MYIEVIIIQFEIVQIVEYNQFLIFTYPSAIPKYFKKLNSWETLFIIYAHYFKNNSKQYHLMTLTRGTHIMLKKMPIMFMLSAPDFAYYAQSFSLLCW
jgi:hypothetical protein